MAKGSFLESARVLTCVFILEAALKLESKQPSLFFFFLWGLNSKIPSISPGTWQLLLASSQYINVLFMFICISHYYFIRIKITLFFLFLNNFFLLLNEKYIKYFLCIYGIKCFSFFLLVRKLLGGYLFFKKGIFS